MAAMASMVRVDKEPRSQGPRRRIVEKVRQSNIVEVTAEQRNTRSVDIDSDDSTNRVAANLLSGGIAVSNTQGSKTRTRAESHELEG